MTSKKFYKAHREEIKKKRKEYYYANLDKAKDYYNKYKTEHPEKIKERNANRSPANIETIRRQKWLMKYGITPEEYNELFEKQDGRCAICNTHQSELKRTLAVDHDHITDKVRGLLCDRCNVMLGMAGDDIRRLLDAVEYLRRV